MTEDKILNPMTNRMVNKNGKIGRLLMKQSPNYLIKNWVNNNLNDAYFSDRYVRKSENGLYDFLFYESENRGNRCWCLIENVDICKSKKILLFNGNDNVHFVTKFQQFKDIFDIVNKSYVTKMIKKDDKEQKRCIENNEYNGDDVLQETGIYLAEVNGFQKLNYP